MSAHRSISVTPSSVTDESDFSNLSSSPFATTASRAAASAAAASAAAAELRSVYRVLDELVKAVTVLEEVLFLRDETAAAIASGSVAYAPGQVSFALLSICICCTIRTVCMHQYHLFYSPLCQRALQLYKAVRGLARMMCTQLVGVVGVTL
jgi:hypothetical protein